MQEEDITMTHKNAASLETSHSKVIVEHCDIIKPDFWEAYPSILNEKPPTFKAISYGRIRIILELGLY